MKIRVLIPLWRRPEVTDFCFDGLDKLISESKHEIKVSCVLSDDTYIDVVEARGYDWVFSRNLPLGDKINAGVRSTLKFEYDYLMMMNSDNIVKSELIDKVYDPFFESMNPFFGIDRVTYVKFGTTEARNVTYDFSVLGIAKMISRETVDKFNGFIYEGSRSKGMDDSMMDKFIRAKISPTFVKYEGDLAFDFKSEVNIHPWEKFVNKGEAVCYNPK